MRILLLIPTLTGAGAERQLAYLGGELQRRGHDVLVGYLHPGPGVWPREVPAHRFAPHWPWSPRLIAEIARLIRAWKPDVVQTCITRMDVAGGIAAGLTGVPHVLREPNDAAAYRDFRSWLRRLVGRRAAAIVANSAEGAAYWSGQRTWVIPNAVPFDEIAAAEPAARAEGAAVLLYAGRLEPQKNVDIVLHALAAVLVGRGFSPPDVGRGFSPPTPGGGGLKPRPTLTICGQGPERERLETLARKLGIAACVHFAGFVHDVWNRQRAADAALLVSSFEGHPNVVSECFAAGTPMILSDIPQHRALAEGDALFVPPGDVVATAAAIRDVLDDRAAAVERARRAQARVSQISIPRMAAAYEDVYATVAASQPVVLEA
ncbi:MAG TPA: glycosyltransferase [Thermoanaerobaculia bacterium]